MESRCQKRVNILLKIAWNLKKIKDILGVKCSKILYFLKAKKNYFIRKKGKLIRMKKKSYKEFSK